MIGPAVYLIQDPRGAVHGAAGDSVRAFGDTFGAAVGTVRDSVGAVPELPGGVAELVRFIFRVPQPIQIGGAVVGGLVALWLAVLAWRNRLGILGWLRTRNKEIQLSLAALALVAVSVAGLAGMKTWNYMQHDNGFCTGCHVMEKPFTRFAVGSGKHEELQCHDCHQQSIFASTRQLVLWVADRPEEIGKHAPLRNDTCQRCHEKEGKDTKKWERAQLLAGHRVHFESDSAPLKDMQCVTCHGQEIHKFIPSARTCQQSGCHEQQSIKLHGMKELPEVNCAVCHDFRKEIPALATTDSAHLALVPAKAQCTSCHQMLQKLEGYRVERDPHNGTCGSCHDVHAHTTPQDARETCVNCHKDLEKSPFHAGPNHKAAQQQCLTCHAPHKASVDASDCVGCHNEVRKRGLSKPPLPFDTNSVLRKRRVTAAHGAPTGEPSTGGA